MKRMWKEHDPQNRIQLKFNRYGQPCGLKTCKLTSFIGYLARGKEIPLASKNWSKVDKSLKEKLWKIRVSLSACRGKACLGYSFPRPHSRGSYQH